ncbi:Type-2 restriction enzyme EcoRII [Enterobacter hormaechei]|nr:Type-2 restriction enzyme EcoRII [Enterobacter hormaechei]
MLAVKTTCKDRWRQILNEANRISPVHLFTLQEGVSQAQYREMQAEGVRLVVPSSIHKKYPEAVRAELMTLGAFIAELTGLYADLP